MADASRFPNLAAPFALAGAAAGWLSCGLAQQPFAYTPDSPLRGLTAALAAGFAAATGALIRRWCVGRRYGWEVDAPDHEARPPSDSWPRHVLAILFAGTATGVALAAIGGAFELIPDAAVVAMTCTLPFLPVCAAVLAAGRRAQRARLGSLVAASDRRAVWGILATALLIASLEALPDWVVAGDGPLFAPIPAVGLLFAATASIAVIITLDVFTWRRLRTAVALGLSRQEASDLTAQDEAAQRLDVGLGNEVHAQIQRGGAAYRSRERAVSLVQGDPERAFAALRRALGRGALGLGLAAAVVAAHIAANTDYAIARYEQLRCENGRAPSCAGAARGGMISSSIAAHAAIPLFERACDGGDGASCMSLAGLYRGSEGVDRDAALVAFFEYRAAQRGLCPEGTRLVHGTENVCVDLLDPRQ